MTKLDEMKQQLEDHRSHEAYSTGNGWTNRTFELLLDALILLTKEVKALKEVSE